MAFTIPDSDDLFNLYNEGVEEMLRVFGVECTVVYPPERQACSNCVTSGIGGVTSNVYIQGGPAPFYGGDSCPLCGGDGWKEIEQTDTVRLRIYWTERDWKKIGYPSIQVPDGHIMTLGNLHDMPKLVRANFVIMNAAQTGYANWRYELSGEPFPFGFGKDRWCAAFWGRAS